MQPLNRFLSGVVGILPDGRAVLAALVVAAVPMLARAALEDQSASRMPQNSDITYGFALADIDADGDLDAIVANHGQVRLLLNDGAASFSDATAARLPALPGTTMAVATGDVDKDGDVDLFIVNGGERNRLLLNDGGTFTDATDRLPEFADLSTAAAIADFDGDGHPDIVVANRGGQNRLLANNQSGAFFDATSFALPAAARRTRHVAVGDVDGDGDRDLLFVSDDGDHRLLLNDGGKFTDATDGRLPAARKRGLHALIHDLDGDGDLDLLLAEGEGGLRLLTNDGTGTFADTTAAAGLDAVAAFAIRTAAGDLDYDGDLDLVVATAGQDLVLLNQGANTFAADAGMLPADTGRTFGLALADLDDDFDLDLLVARLSAQNRLLINRIAFPRIRIAASPGQVETGKEVTITVEVRDEDGIQGNPQLTITPPTLAATLADLNLVDNVASYVYTPQEEGLFTAAAFATDTQNVDATRSTTFTVVANVVPTVDAGPTATLNLGATFASSGSFTDPGDTAWNGTVDYGDGSAVEDLILTAEKTFELNHQYDDHGTFTVTVRIDDGQDIGIGTTTVTVENQPPVVAQIPGRVVQDPVPFPAITLDDYVTDPDHADDQIVWSVSGETDLSVAIVDRVATITYEKDARVTETLTFTATDPLGATASTTATFTVAAETGDFLRPFVTLSTAPNLADVGQNITLTVTVTDDSGDAGIVARSLTVDGNPLTLDGNNQATFSSVTPGVYTAVATAMDAAGNEGQATAEFRVILQGDNTYPTAEITSPENEMVLSGPTDIIGTATDANFVRYTLSYSPMAQNEFVVFHTGTSQVSNAKLGTFDPTMLQNGMYDVRVTVEDASGNLRFATRQYRVSGQQKVGHVKLRMRDMEIPVAGLDITIYRTYDNRNKRKGDFGYGWDLETSDIEVVESRIPGENWYHGSQAGGGLFGTAIYYVDDSHAPHYVSVKYPSGRVDRFVMKLSPAQQTTVPINYPTVYWEAAPGTYSTISIPGGETDLLIYSEGYVDLYDYSGVLYNPDTYRITRPNGYSFLVHDTDGLQSITDPSGYTLTFNDSGMIHSAGRSVAFERDGEGRITKITDPLGNTISYEYDAYGDLVTVTDQEGGVTKFIYDNDHNLIDTIGPDGTRGMRSEYDDDGRLIGQVDRDGNRRSYTHDVDGKTETIRLPDGSTTTLVYDDNGNVTSYTDALGNTSNFTYDADGNALTETDPLGNTITQTFDNNGNLLTQELADGTTVSNTYTDEGLPATYTDPEGRVTTMEWNQFGKLDKVTYPDGTFITQTFNGQGRMTSRTNEAGETWTYEYNSTGDLTKQTDPRGNAITYTYDSNGNRTSKTKTRTRADNTVVNVTRSATYDGLNRKTSETDAEGNTTSWALSATGRLESVTDPRGKTYGFGTDQAGRPNRVQYPDGSSSEVAFDSRDIKTSRTNRLGKTTTYEYDANGRPIGRTMPMGLTYAHEYDAAGRRKSFTNTNGGKTTGEFDALGRPTTVKDPEGNTHTREYNDSLLPSAVVDAEGNRTEFTYDARNRMSGIKLANNKTWGVDRDPVGRITKSTDPLGRETDFEYDAMSNLTKVTDAADGVTAYEYDELGNLVKATDARGKVTSMEYDNNGRRIGRKLPSNLSESWEYDPNGNLDSHTTAAGAVDAYTYDDQNRCTRRTFPNGTWDLEYDANGHRTKLTDAHGDTAYEYDDLGRMTKVTYPNGLFVQYTYGTTTLPTAIITPDGTTAYQYDLNGRITAVTDPDNAVTTYEYDGNGNRTKTTFPNGVVTTGTYDELDRLTLLLTKDNADNTLEQFTYTYDDINRITSVTDHDGRRVDYTYDDLNQLTRETITDGAVETIEYTYDATGNRLTRTDTDGTVSTYVYDDDSRLVSDTTTTYTYDDNGNLTRAASANRTVEYEYDIDNLLTKATVTEGGNTTVVEYKYLDRKLYQRIEDGVKVTNYLIDPSQPLWTVLLETDDTNAVQKRFVYGGGLISQKQAGGVSYHHHDVRGSTRALTDSTGTPTDTYTYDAFGRQLAVTGATDNNRRYVSEPVDAVTGLIHLRARHYAPDTGRFLQRDPLEGETTKPSSQWPYPYAGNDPVNNTDPSGQFSIASVCVSVAIVATLAAINTVMIQVGIHPITIFADNLSDANCDDFETGTGKLTHFGGVWLMAFTSASGSISSSVALGAQVTIARAIGRDGKDFYLRQNELHFPLSLKQIPAFLKILAGAIADGGGEPNGAWNSWVVFENWVWDFMNDSFDNVGGWEPEFSASVAVGVGVAWDAQNPTALGGWGIGLGFDIPIGGGPIGIGLGFSRGLNLDEQSLKLYGGSPLGAWALTVSVSASIGDSDAVGIDIGYAWQLDTHPCTAINL